MGDCRGDHPDIHNDINGWSHSGVVVNPRERFNNLFHFQPIDRFPFWEMGFWDETLLRWYIEDGFEVDKENPFVSLGLDWPYPLYNISSSAYGLFDTAILSTEGDRERFIDEYGRVGIRLTSGTSVPKWEKFPVTGRISWRNIRDRYEQRGVFDPHRENFERLLIEMPKPMTVPYGAMIGSLFGELRTLMGLEGLSYMLYDDPLLVHEMLEFLSEFMRENVSKFLLYVDLDFVKFWEDMAYINGSFISPRVWKEFFAPYYKHVLEPVYNAEIDIVLIDSDGDVSELIPLWLDVGINCPYPMEARCNDLMSYRKTYGQHLRMIGGVDKGRIALGRRSIDQFILRDTRDLVRLGGYIPHIDHAIPPSISFSDYKYYRNLLALISDEVGADRV